MGRSADYPSVPQFDLLNWVSDGARTGCTKEPRTGSPHALSTTVG